jgi:hypothetical protein
VKCRRIDLVNKDERDRVRERVKRRQGNRAKYSK